MILDRPSLAPLFRVRTPIIWYHQASQSLVSNENCKMISRYLFSDFVSCFVLFWFSLRGNGKYIQFCVSWILSLFETFFFFFLFFSFHANVLPWVEKVRMKLGISCASLSGNSRISGADCEKCFQSSKEYLKFQMNLRSSKSVDAMIFF